MWGLHSASSYKLRPGVRADVSVPTSGCLCLVLLAFFRFRSQPGARRVHKSGSRTGRLRLAVGAQEASARLCLHSSLVHAGSTLAGFRAGVPAPRAFLLHRASRTTSPSQPRRPDTTSESFSTQTPKQQLPAQKTSPALKTTRHPWSVHLDSFPKLFLVIRRAHRLLVPQPGTDHTPPALRVQSLSC